MSLQFVGTTATAPPATLEAEYRRILADKFDIYSRACLHLRPKSGDTVPFILNRVQLYLHAAAETQLRRNGKVRIIILKGRQQGCSSYVEGRLFWKVQHRRGMKAFILTHHADASANLFRMSQRFLDLLPEHSKPEVKTASQRELTFAKLDSGYRVGTAGTEGVGRSDTIQLFHGSEVAFWPHAEEHAAGALQAVPSEKGTEVWLESTANGMGNFYHQQWQLAESGRSEYQAIFIPWFWTDEYTAATDAAFKREPEEAELGELFGLTDGQLAWRRAKIIEFGAGESGKAKFQQEYPFTVVEAFQASGGPTFILQNVIMKARRFKVEEDFGALIMGVDPAGEGEDDTAIILRRGRRMFGIRKFHGLDPMEVTGQLTLLIDEIQPDRVFLDVGGLGSGIYARLRELKYDRIVTPINFGNEASDKNKYPRKREEMWGRLRDWFYEASGVEIPDDNELHADLTAPGFTHDSLQRVKLETKAHMRARGVRSPDLGDAAALTFAYSVHMQPEEVEKRPDPYAIRPNRLNKRRHWSVR